MRRKVRNAGRKIGRGIKKVGRKVGHGIKKAARAIKRVGVHIAEDAGWIRKHYPKAPLTWVEIRKKLAPIKDRATRTAG